MKNKKPDMTETVFKEGEAEKPGESGGKVPAGGDDKTPAEGHPKDPQVRIQELEEEAARLETETKANYERFLRERAELENFKKRVAREREEVMLYGSEALVRDLLPVIDNLERALEHAESGGNGQPLLEGVNLVREGLLGALSRHGVTCVSALGERFDPARHEAMDQVESDEHEANTVVREHQKGYMLRDRLIRPALVSVSKPGAGRQGIDGGNGDCE